MSLTALTFEGRSTRFTGEGCIVASDLAAALGYRDAANMVRILDEDEKGYSVLSTPGGDQRVTVVTEAGFYRICVSRQTVQIKDAEARAFVKRFQRWVTHEVLPSLRKTGSYGRDPMAALSDPATLRQLLMGYSEKVLSLEAANAELAPKAEVFDRIVASGDTLGFREAAKIVKAATGATEPELKMLMISKRWIQRLGGRLAPASYGEECKYVTVREREVMVRRQEGGDEREESRVFPELRVTQRGVAHAIKLLSKEDQ